VKPFVWSPQAERDDLPSFVEHPPQQSVQGRPAGHHPHGNPCPLFLRNPPNNRLRSSLIRKGIAHGVVSTRLRAVDAARSVQPNPGSERNERPTPLEIHPRGSVWRRKFPERKRRKPVTTPRRETSASSVTANSPTGPQREKFLFYRGVSSLDVPVTALPQNNRRILVSNRTQSPIPQAILFERRGTRFGYRILGSVHRSSVVDAPDLDADLASLAHDLEQILIANGLYPDEARAMLQNLERFLVRRGHSPPLHRPPAVRRQSPSAHHRPRAVKHHSRLRRPPRSRHSRNRKTPVETAFSLRRPPQPSLNTAASSPPFCKS